MDGDPREEWGAIALGFGGFFLVLAFMVIGIMPVWLVLMGLFLLVAAPIALTMMARKLLFHHQ